MDAETLQRTFDAAVQAHGEGRLDNAEAGFRAVLAVLPHEGEALFGLGLTLMGLRRFTEAVAPLHAAAAQPGAAPVRFLCLAQALYLTGAFAQAAETFAAMENQEGFHDGARLTWARSAAYAALDDSDADTALALYGRIAGPVAEDLDTVASEGFSALVAFQRLDAARKLGRWLETRSPGDAIQAHELRVLTDPEIDRAPPAYVEALFDAFAERFDHQLVDNLEYQAPAILAQMVGVTERRFEHMLDLGCGTGLAGPPFRAGVARLTGVDLSTAMLAKAAERGGYDALVHAEAVAFLRETRQRFDLIVAADVFSYLGDLADILAAAAEALSDEGLLAFSVEQGETGWRLLPSARYAHGDDYVRAGAAGSGFEVMEHRQTPLRRQADAAIPGGLYVLRKIAR
ncbi:MAG: methyltransferase [Caulobacter sp.]|nr:methyltransferase [Caulobacter sp.]